MRPLWPAIPRPCGSFVIAGLKVMPGDVNAPMQHTFLRSVWNKFTYTPADGDPKSVRSQYLDGRGFRRGRWRCRHGTRPTPWYQRAFGLLPASANPDPYGGPGRGAPDVAANSDGNMAYYTPPGDMVGAGRGTGTSAAAPLWAALMAQVDTIFADQGLPNLGFSNDLLYIAADVAPASFNDITMGNNVSSYYKDPNSSILFPGTPSSPDSFHAVPTGFDYEATAGRTYHRPGLAQQRAAGALAELDRAFPGCTSRVSPTWWTAILRTAGPAARPRACCSRPCRRTVSRWT